MREFTSPWNQHDGSVVAYFEELNFTNIYRFSALDKLSLLSVCYAIKSKVR